MAKKVETKKKAPTHPSTAPEAHQVLEDPTRFASKEKPQQEEREDLEALRALRDMGFSDPEKCRQALWLHQGSIEDACGHLIAEAERDSIRRTLGAPVPISYRNLPPNGSAAISKGAGVKLNPTVPVSTTASSYAALAAPLPDPNSIEAIRASLGAPKALR